MATGDVYENGFRRTSDGALYVTFDGTVIPTLAGGIRLGPTTNVLLKSDSSGGLLVRNTGDTLAAPILVSTIETTGAIGVGVAPQVTGNTAILIGKTIAGATSGYGINATSAVQSAVTGTYIGFRSIPSTQAAAFTLTNLKHFAAEGATIGAASAATFQYGFHVDSTLTTGGTNFGFRSDIAAGASRWNFYGGTADSSFGGNVRVGSNVAPTVALDVTGAVQASTSLAAVGANGQSLAILQLTELTTIAAAATTDTTIQMPAGAVVLAVPVRVTTLIPTAATFTVGDSGSAARFNTGSNVAVAATTTNAGTKAGAYYNASALSIRITPDVQPADNTGRVRVTIYYFLSTPPTS